MDLVISHQSQKMGGFHANRSSEGRLFLFDDKGLIVGHDTNLIHRLKAILTNILKGILTLGDLTYQLIGILKPDIDLIIKHIKQEPVIKYHGIPAYALTSAEKGKGFKLGLGNGLNGGICVLRNVILDTVCLGLLGKKGLYAALTIYFGNLIGTQKRCKGGLLSICHKCGYYI